MARALIVGCGCHGRELGAALSDRDWRVRGTSRDATGLEAIAAAGLEPAQADPDRPGTVLDLCGDVGVVVWLLGSATGGLEVAEAIHGPRLERLLEKLVESPVRGFAYESAGSLSPELLRGGREIVERAARTWRIPAAFIDGARDDPNWAERSAAATAALLAA